LGMRFVAISVPPAHKSQQIITNWVDRSRSNQIENALSLLIRFFGKIVFSSCFCVNVHHV
jgi:hypothetical protein